MVSEVGDKDCGHEQARRLRAVEAKLKMSVKLASLGKQDVGVQCESRLGMEPA